MKHRLLPWTTALRVWQESAFQSVLSHPGHDFLVVATPGAGKTRLALRVAHHALTAGKVRRIVVVCPTSHLREQWAEAGHRDGLQLAPDIANRHAREADDYHGMTVTYQQICAEPAVYRRRSAQEPTLVVFDEIHHAGEGKEWGEALRRAFEPASQRLLLSGTPFRTDDNPIPYVRYNADRRSIADFTYGYLDAIKEGVCRPILFPSYEGEVSWVSQGRTMEATFRDGLKKAQRRERLKTALLQEEWLEDVVADADAKLSEIRTNGHANAGGLVVAMNQTHARAVADLLRRVTGETASVAVSDDPGASRTIRAFARSQRRWLVAVNMVSEGVDIPRLRVGVYASNVLTEMYFRQVVGRFVRMSHTGGQDVRAYLYISRDPTLVSYARQIQQERNHALRPDGGALDEATRQVQAQGTPNNEYLPLRAVAQEDECIGDDFTLTSPDTPATSAPPIPEAAPVLSSNALPLFEQKQAKRELHKRLVSQLALRDKLEHRLINLSLKEQTGTSIDRATMQQLDARIRLLQRWLEKGYSGRR
jgi:superfamily II DNA or RNA helicase